MKHIPFTFGKVVFDLDFTNREDETEFLSNQFKALNNVALISPRRWGKSSLIKYVTQKLVNENKEYRIIYLDLFNIKSEEEFYREFANKLLNATINKFERLIQKSGNLFKNILPKFSYNPVPESEISLSLEWSEIKKNPSEILNLAETIAQSEGIRIIFCIDEFQNLQHFDNPMAFQKSLRAHWQHHQHVSYCLYGSKEHMMQDIFNKSSYPFYRFATILNLNKIKPEKWNPFIKKRFEDTGKEIEESAIQKIIEYADNQPYYVQQLAQTSWLICDKICDKSIVDKALENIMEQYGSFFIRDIENLTTSQINLLKAITDGVKSFGTRENLNLYDLKSTANINRVKKSLQDKQIIRFENRTAEFQDAIFGLWLRKIYFPT